MNRPRLFCLALLLSTAFAEPASVPFPTIDFQAPSLDLAAEAADPLTPVWVRKAAQTSVPSYPRLRNLGLTSIGLAPFRDFGEPPNPVVLLGDALRQATFVEAWDLESDLEPPTDRTDWEISAHRNLEIARVARWTANADIVALFTRATEALVDYDPQWSRYLPQGNAATPDQAVATIKFSPILLLTFSGPHPAQIEIDVHSNRALLLTADQWGFYAFPFGNVLPELVAYLKQHWREAPRPHAAPVRFVPADENSGTFPRR